MSERRPVREIEHILIPLKDGTGLAARIWLPKDAEQRPVPAILEYLPYRKRAGTDERDALTHPYFAARGYAGVRVDVRGSGESGGLLVDEYSQQELDDALEVIAWLAAQPWCSGAVGMMGISWGGFNALQVAALRPPALKAIITLCSTDDRYADDVHYMGGAKLNAGFGWGSFLFSDMCHPPDPVLAGEHWREMWLERLERLPLFFELWLQHQHRDAYWKHGSICEDYAAIRCPVYAVGGWTDGYTNAIPRLLEHLKVPRKGLIGPWAHAYPHFARPGPRVGFLQEALRWWDHWLKGEATGVMDEPMLRVWISDSMKPATSHDTLPGRWVTETSWPPPSVSAKRLYVTDLGLRDDAASLAPCAVRSPLGLGRHAGEWCPFGRGNDQADDQREDDALSVLFETSPLETEIDLLGAPLAELEISSDKPVAHLVARLCDVRPNGESLRLSFGVLNLTHRESHEAPMPLEPGRRYRVRLKLNDCGARVPAGHRLRLALSTNYWPMIWPAPEIATVTIHCGTLDLPMRLPGGRPPAPLRPPESATPERITRPRPGVVRYDRIGLQTETQWRFRADVNGEDPLSAVTEMSKQETIERATWKVRIEASMRMTCTRHVFEVSASIVAVEGEEKVFRRSWAARVPRMLL